MKQTPSTRRTRACAPYASTHAHRQLAAPQEVVELRHVLRQGVGRHRRQVRLHRRAAGQPAVGRVGVALRRPARERVRRHPARARTRNHGARARAQFVLHRCTDGCKCCETWGSDAAQRRPAAKAGSSDAHALKCVARP